MNAALSAAQEGFRQAQAAEPVRDIPEAVMREVSAFCWPLRKTDDLTQVVIKVVWNFLPELLRLTPAAGVDSDGKPIDVQKWYRAAKLQVQERRISDHRRYTLQECKNPRAWFYIPSNPLAFRLNQ